MLKLTDKGRNFLEKPHPIELARDHDFTTAIEEEEESDKTPGPTKSYDEKLFEMLKVLRKKIVRRKRTFPPYVVFQDPSLEEMATTFPTTKDDLASVNGVGMGKVNKFGKEFIELIRKYAEENDIETVSDIIVKTSVNKSKIKIFIIQQIDRQINLDEIAHSKNVFR